MITQELLKELFNYDQESGIFTRKVNRANNKVKSGDVVGVISSCGYLYVGIGHKRYFLHRLAWLYVYGSFPIGHIDHINRAPADNRISNLRVATNQQNAFNTKIRSDNSSGHKGVHWNKLSNNWRVRACLNQKHISLGCYKIKEDAIKAYKDFIETHHGDFIPQ